MAFAYNIDPGRRIAAVTVSGVTSGSELAEATRALYEDENWRDGTDVIWDLTEVTELLLEWGDLQGLIAIDRQYAEVAGSGRDVIVVARKLDEAMARIHSNLSKSGPRQSHVCRSLVEARVILGIDENQQP
jgi:hypothetical protein